MKAASKKRTYQDNIKTSTWEWQDSSTAKGWDLELNSHRVQNPRGLANSVISWCS